MKKIILVDGNNLLFRSFYATAYQGVIMKNSKGFPTNALYGFINMMNKIIKEENPTYIMVAFDKGKTFRHDKYEEYKEKNRNRQRKYREKLKNESEINNVTVTSCNVVEEKKEEKIKKEILKENNIRKEEESGFREYKF